MMDVPPLCFLCGSPSLVLSEERARRFYFTETTLFKALFLTPPRRQGMTPPAFAHFMTHTASCAPCLDTVLEVSYLTKEKAEERIDKKIEEVVDKAGEAWMSRVGNRGEVGSVGVSQEGRNEGRGAERPEPDGIPPIKVELPSEEGAQGEEVKVVALTLHPMDQDEQVAASRPLTLALPTLERMDTVGKTGPTPTRRSTNSKGTRGKKGSTFTTFSPLPSHFDHLMHPFQKQGTGRLPTNSVDVEPSLNPRVVIKPLPSPSSTRKKKKPNLKKSNFACSKCYVVCRSGYELTVHETIKHQLHPKEAIKLHNCPHCAYNSPKESNVTRHGSLVHGEKGRVKVKGNEARGNGSSTQGGGTKDKKGGVAVKVGEEDTPRRSAPPRKLQPGPNPNPSTALDAHFGRTSWKGKQSSKPRPKRGTKAKARKMVEEVYSDSEEEEEDAMFYVKMEEEVD